MLNIRKITHSCVSLLVVAAFIVTPAIASPPTESKSVAMATTTEPTTTVKLTRVTVSVSRTGARDAITSPYSKYFDAEALAFLMVYSSGWDLQEWECLRNVWNEESRFNPKAQNKNSTAYGIPQFLDSTWEAYGFKKTSDAKEQILAGLIYIDKRYGSACNAWSHWEQKSWY